jgi:hypothetical protein
MAELNAIASRAWNAISAKYPDWSSYLSSRDDGELEVAVPSPAGSSAGYLGLLTDGGEHLWVRFSPPSMWYPLDDEHEMLDVVAKLLSEEALFVTMWRDGEWAGTTLLRPGDEPPLERGEEAHVVSWTGAYDRVVRPKA